MTELDNIAESAVETAEASLSINALIRIIMYGVAFILLRLRSMRTTLTDKEYK